MEQLDAFKKQLAEALPSNVDAVMQGSAVENGGRYFQTTSNIFESASDFDVSLAGRDLYERAVTTIPGFAKNNRVGPLKEPDLGKLGIDTGNLSGEFNRDTEFMIYPDTVEVYKRGAGCPLVTRK